MMRTVLGTVTVVVSETAAGDWEGLDVDDLLGELTQELVDATASVSFKWNVTIKVKSQPA